MLTVYEHSPLGDIILCAHEGKLRGLWFAGQKYEQAGAGQEQGEAPGDRDCLRKAADWLRAYFAGERPAVTLPLDPQGTVFQQQVWAALREIPYGESLSYGAIAQRIGCKSARAVGVAVGRNPISLMIPCHRVVGAQGALTGYAGGLERKKALLTLEHTAMIDSEKEK